MLGNWRWFGSRAKQQDSPRNAMIDLQGQLEMLHKRKAHLQVQMDEQHALARKSVSTNKAAAKRHLERRKMYESYRDQTEKHIATLTQQAMTLESANINQEALAAIERATAAMKQMHGALKPEQVDEIMDDLREENALSSEIVEAMNAVRVANYIDEEDLDTELEELQQEVLDEQMLQTGTVPVSGTIQGMPAVGNRRLPSNSLAVEEEDLEAELKQLQAQMAV